MKKFLTAVLCLMLFCLPLCSCKQNVYPLTATQFMMDTVITVTLYDGDSSALDGAIELCRKYDNMLSKTVKTGDVYKINTSNGRPVEVSHETAELIRFALEIAESTEGAFDPTILPLAELWDVANATSVPPSADIEAALKSVNYKNISVDGNVVTAADGATIDLGGIAKGYIADKVKEYLISEGVKSAVINLGGNTLLLGNKNGNPFSVGVQKPFGLSGELSAILMLDDKTAVTSGVYQRYFEADGKLYHHIIDTDSGYPVDNGIYAVTVITDSSCIADGLSTACLTLGIDKGKELAEQYGAELILITSDGELVLTDGLELNPRDGSNIITLKT